MIYSFFSLESEAQVSSAKAPEVVLQEKESEPQISSRTIEEVPADPREVDGDICVNHDSEVTASVAVDKELFENVIECNGTKAEHKNANDSSSSSSKSGFSNQTPLADGIIVGGGSREVKGCSQDCLYRICSQCLDSLHGLIQKLLLKEWEQNKNNWTVEDVHDTVATLSVDISAALRKDFADKSKNLFLESELIKASEEPNTNTHCSCSSIPVECNSAKQGTSRKCKFGSNVVLVVKDGVIESVEAENDDVHFHCKFERLCLGLLVELVANTKPPV